MIPALSAKLGATFGIPFMHHKDRLVIEGGYQVDYYFNVVDQIQFGIPPGGKFGQTHNLSDVGLMGPYLNVNFK